MVDADLVVRTAALCRAGGRKPCNCIARTFWCRASARTRTQLSIISGSLLAFAVCYLLVPPDGFESGRICCCSAVIALFGQF